MRIKSGRGAARLGPHLAMSAMFAIFTELERTFDGFFTITSGREGKHSPGSLHYVDQAVDVKFFGKAPQRAMVSSLKYRLGDDFDVVHERSHIHIEFQPKKPL